MTATTATTHLGAAAPPRRYGGTPFGRIANVVRLQLGNPWTPVILPWMILGFIFLGNIAVLLLIGINTGGRDARDAREGFSYSGASFYIFIYMMVVAIQSINITFPFALGLGVTRRDYWLGSSVTFVLLATMYSVGITILGLIERATGGWGLGGAMFAPVYYGEEWWQRLLVVFIALLFFLFLGSALGVIYLRWKATGMIVFFASLATLLIVTGFVLTFTNRWPGLGAALAAASPLEIASWFLIPTALAGVLGFFIMQKATPHG